MNELSSTDIQELTDLARKLAYFNCEEYFKEIVVQIWGPKSLKLREDFNNIKRWTTEDVCAWFKGLSFLKQDETAVLSKLYNECIDGEFLSTMDHECWVRKLGLSYRIFVLIEIIFHGWVCGSKTLRLPDDIRKLGVMTGIEADLSHLDPHTKTALIKADDDCALTGAGGVYGQLVVLGYKEYRTVDSVVTPLGLTNEKYVLRRRTVPNGLRSLQQPFALSSAGSEQLPLTSSRYTLTLALSDDDCSSLPDVSPDVSEVQYHFLPDPRWDMFQIGRAQNSINDLVVPGLVHEEIDGVVKGVVSRHACRVMCERLPPHRCFILAGGFATKKNLTVNKVIHHSAAADPSLLSSSVTASSDLLSSLDGFTTFGVKLWQPEVDQWLEVSVLGNTYLPRTHYTTSPTERIASVYGNQLTNGSILDIGGVSLLFQSPVQMAQTENVNPLGVVSFLNSLHPHCPVLMNDLHFLHLDPKQRALRAMRGENEAFSDSTLLPPHYTSASRNGGGSSSSSGSNSSSATGRGCYISTAGGTSASLAIPLTDYSDLAEEARTYVFPACGHVHGYHRSMEGRPCPLCRRVGPFVPVALPFEPALCDGRPTHVFNPCGHVASRATCHYWSTRVRLYSSRVNPIMALVPKPCCPFCAVDLVLCDETGGESFSRRGGGSGSTSTGGLEVGGMYYSRLILQTSSDDQCSASSTASQLWSDEPSLAEEEQRRTELQLASHREDQVRHGQQVLFQREQEELRARAAGGHGGDIAGDVMEMRKFPKYLGESSGL